MTTVQETKQEERQARRRRIQHTARQVFADKGYTRTSIEQVARRAGLSVGAIYLYFRSKEELYVSLLEEELERFDSDLTRMAEGAGSLRDAWNYLVDWAERDNEGPRMLRFLARAETMPRLSDEVAACVAAGVVRVREHLAVLVRHNVENGAYRALESAERITEIVDVFWALYLGALQASDMDKNLGVSGAGFARAAHAAFDVLENGLRTRTTRVAEAA